MNNASNHEEIHRQWAEAVMRCDEGQMEAVWARGIDINMTLPSKYYPSDARDENDGDGPALCFAAGRGLWPAVNWLLDHGADPYRQDKRERDPLTRAIVLQDDHRGLVIRRLLAANVDPNRSRSSPHWQSALSTAARMRDIDVMDMLLEAGVDVQDRDWGVFHALHHLFWRPVGQIPWTERTTAMAQRLVDQGLNPLDESASLPILHLALRSGLLRHTMALLEVWYQARPDAWFARNKKGDTPLHWAVKYSPEGMDLLLQKHRLHGVDVHPVDAEGKTPLDRLREATIEEIPRRDLMLVMLVEYDRAELREAAKSTARVEPGVKSRL